MTAAAKGAVQIAPARTRIERGDGFMQQNGRMPAGWFKFGHDDLDESGESLNDRGAVLIEHLPRSVPSLRTPHLDE